MTKNEWLNVLLNYPTAGNHYSLRGNYVLKRRFRTLSLLVLLMLCSILIGCSTRYEKQVVIHCDAKQAYAGPILASFARQFPKDEFQVVKRSLLQSNLQEFLQSDDTSPAEKLEGDVVWDTDLLRTLKRQREGLLLSRNWSIPRDWPSPFRASDGTWVAFAARARVLIINDQVGESVANPSSIFDLGAPLWKDTCGIASLSSPSVRVHLAIIASRCDFIKIDADQNQSIASEKQSLDFEKWTEVLSQNVRIYEEESQLASAVVRGEIHWGVVDSDLAVAIRNQNPSVRIVFPDQTEGGFGTVLIPDTVSVMAAAKNPKVAGRLADFLISDDVEARLTISDSATIPLNPSPKELSRLLKGLDVRWAEVKVNDLVDAWDVRVGRYTEKLRANGRD
jgi:iron(III) transport system substrate-binding protein